MNLKPPTLTRRSFIWKLLVLPPALVLAACTGRTLEEVLPSATAPAATEPIAFATDVPPSATVSNAATDAPAVVELAPTPACDDGDDDPTPAQTAGPFFTPNSPERTSLVEAGMAGTLLTVRGQVLTTDCLPLSNVLIDFWQCDAAGNYDNVGYTLRGHQFTDANGDYLLETILPGLYPGRTRHIHVRVQAANQPILTTQLYFPDTPENARDGIYNSVLEMAISPVGDELTGHFDFVLASQ